MTFYLTRQLCPEHWQRLDPSPRLQSHRWKPGAARADLEWLLRPAPDGGSPPPRHSVSGPLAPSTGQVPSWLAGSPFSVVLFYLTTGPSDFELLRRSVKAAFLLESREETDLMFCPQGEKQGHFN